MPRAVASHEVRARIARILFTCPARSASFTPRARSQAAVNASGVSPR